MFKIFRTGAIMDIVDKIMAYEDGLMSETDTIAFFQELIDTGQAWSLQGAYGRMAKSLIDAGYCHEAH